MARGGPRAGAGRPRGSKNRITRLRQDVAERALAEGISPLDVMLRTMRELWSAGKRAEATKVAKEAAPYVHPRLSAVDADVKKHFDLSGLSDDELDCVIESERAAVQMIESARPRAAKPKGRTLPSLSDRK